MLVNRNHDSDKTHIDNVKMGNKVWTIGYYAQYIMQGLIYAATQLMGDRQVVTP